MSAKYKEFIEYQNFNDIQERDTVRKELQTFYVISVPAENEWVRAMEAELYQIPTMSNSQGNVSHKRSLEEESAMDTQEDLENTDSSNPQKRQCSNSSESNGNQIPKTTISNEHLLNFPLEDKNGKSCLVKVYTNQDQIKLNNIYEFIGFLSIDPKLSHECVPESEKNLEMEMHNPPPPLIPRLHSLSFRKLKQQSFGSEY
ncbi:hypothetical protein HHI36_014663 [Cryptolaemus montrouzieri]|uniref:Mini-chromosome maintenance complex-binding protein n=1 Tax=Cryptolaemus montrouzieri TaxID=559131 RepID=A0ABD2N445_9CUCU